MADLTLSIIEKVLKGCNVPSSVFSSVKNTFIDSGLYDSLNNWKDSYYSYRIPKSFSQYTLSQQLHNLESEVYLLRSDNYLNGIDRNIRTMSSFKIEKNEKNHTILVPTTRLSKIILANTFNDDFSLPAATSVNIENLIRECRDYELKSDLLEKENQTLKIQIDKLKSEIESFKSLSNIDKKLIDNLNNHIYKLHNQVLEKGTIIEQLKVEITTLECLIFYDENELENREKIIRNLASQLDYDVELIEDQFVKDLTTEGIEPNPGPNTFYAELYSFLNAINLKIKHQFSFDLKDKNIHIVQLLCEELNEYDYWETEFEDEIEKHCFFMITKMLNRHKQYLIESRCDHYPEYIHKMINHLDACYQMMSGFLFINAINNVDFDISDIDSDSEDEIDYLMNQMEREMERRLDELEFEDMVDNFHRMSRR